MQQRVARASWRQLQQRFTVENSSKPGLFEGFQAALNENQSRGTSWLVWLGRLRSAAELSTQQFTPANRQTRRRETLAQHGPAPRSRTGTGNGGSIGQSIDSPLSCIHCTFWNRGRVGPVHALTTSRVPVAAFLVNARLLLGPSLQFALGLVV